MLYYILIIIVILFIFLFIKNKEQFKSDYSDYNSIDRIKINKNDIIDVNNEYAKYNIENDMFAYCIGATPKCENGLPIKIGVYPNGNTYKSTCDDGSNMICKNFMSTADSNEWKISNNTIKFSDIYKGFTEPTSYIPAVINNNLINFYDENDNILDTIDKCSILGSEKNNCNKASNIPFPFADATTSISYEYKYGDTNVSGVYDPNAINASIGYITEPTPDIGTFTQSYTQTTPKSNGKSGMYPNLPCIADYGSLPGDNVCNGEIGLIQDDTLICPYYKPICQGYRCDSNFGKCTYSK